MLISIRRFAAPELGARVFRVVARHPGFLVRLAEFAGGVAEDRLFDAAEQRTTLPGWPVLAVALAGSVLVRHGDDAVLAGAGELVWVPSGGAFRARSGEGGVRVLLVQWDPAIFGRPGGTSLVTQRLRGAGMDRLRGAVRRLAAAGYAAERASVAVAQLFAELCALGLVDARPAPDQLVLPGCESLAPVGIAIDLALSSMQRNPMALDLEAVLGRSPAQTRRLLRRYGQALDLPGAVTWRELRNVWRLTVGALLMTTPGARTERVADLLGYGSATAFCHAFAGAGLPSPGDVRRAVRDLA